MARFGLSLVDPSHEAHGTDFDAMPAWAGAENLTRAAWRDYDVGPYETAARRFKTAMDLAESAGEQRSQSLALLGRAWAARRLCDMASAEQWTAEAHALAVQLGDASLQANVINTQRAQLRKGLALVDGRDGRPSDRWQAARFRQRLGRLDVEDSPSKAIVALTEVAKTQLELGTLDDLAWSLQDLEVAPTKLGELERSATLYGARTQLVAEIGFGMTDPGSHDKSLDRYAWTIRVAKEQSMQALGERWDVLVEEGRRLTRDQPDPGPLRQLLEALRRLGEQA